MFTNEELIFIHGILMQVPLNFQQGQVRVVIMSKIENFLNKKDEQSDKEKESRQK